MGKVSLADFASAQPNLKSKCPICRLPADVVAQVREAKGAVAATVIARWLNAEHGLSLNPNGSTVRTHLSSHGD